MQFMNCNLHLQLRLLTFYLFSFTFYLHLLSLSHLRNSVFCLLRWAWALQREAIDFLLLSSYVKCCFFKSCNFPAAFKAPASLEAASRKHENILFIYIFLHPVSNSYRYLTEKYLDIQRNRQYDQ